MGIMLPILCAHMRGKQQEICEVHGTCAPRDAGKTLSKSVCADFHRVYRRGEAREAQSTELPPCKNLGDPIGETATCQSCGGGRTQLKVFSCSIYGKCTTDPKRPVSGIANCSDTCLGHSERPITLNLGAGGLGDALLCMAAVKGAREANPNRRIIYKVHPNAIPFVNLFDHGADELAVHDWDDCADRPKGAKPGDTQLNGGYGDECRSKCELPRVLRWCRNAGGVRPIKVLPRNLDNLRDSCPVEYRGTIILAPFSTWAAREYPVHSWKTVERMLLELGYRVLTIDKRDSRYPDRHKQMRGEVLVDADARRVSSIVASASLLIGGDSGPAHLAAALGTKTIVLSGPVTVSKVYGFYGNHVHALEGHLDCRGCFWQPPYSSRNCEPNCPALASNTPQEVVAKAVELIGSPVPGRSSTFHVMPGETGKAHARRQREGWFSHIVAPAIDIGCGRDPLVAGFPIRRWDQLLGDGDCVKLEGVADGSLATVYASHVLEHVPDPGEALRRWWRALASGGKLIVCVPHLDLYEGKAELPSIWNGDHKTFWLPDVGETEHVRGLRQEIEQAIPDGEIVSLRVLDAGHVLPDVATKRHAMGEYSIEAIVRKMTPSVH